MTTDEDQSFEEGIADEKISIADGFDQTVLKGILEETIQQITPDQRAAVMLHDIEGLTFEEAGKALGKPMNTVKSNYRRAIEVLRKLLTDKGF